jgi:hypothetical protein
VAIRATVAYVWQADSDRLGGCPKALAVALKRPLGEL